MKKITAEYVFPITSAPIKDGVIVIDDNGKIVEIGNRSDYKESELEYHQGIIVPGFINTHCHLELSHMKGKVDTGTGLIPFIKGVVTSREVKQYDIDEAIRLGDEEMVKEGIVAVGDISNKLDTANQKGKSPIRYYSFVEMFDFLQDEWAENEFNKYHEVYLGQASENGNRKSGVPHAPYTVSPTLFKKINHLNNSDDITVSIHNQETVEENLLFLTKTGGFIDFYKDFKISLEKFEATGKPSIQYALQYMNPKARTLFVHNTMTDEKDIKFAQNWSDKTYWATCPNANLYIENRLPNYQVFIDNDVKMTIGTDSLTSNWRLSILSEMKTISKYQSYVSFETLLKWATINGAEALGMDDELGSLEIGKQPGINLLTGLDIHDGIFRLNDETAVVKLI